jgi:hypothetical protein
VGSQESFPDGAPVVGEFGHDRFGMARALHSAAACPGSPLDRLSCTSVGRGPAAPDADPRLADGLAVGRADFWTIPLDARSAATAIPYPDVVHEVLGKVVGGAPERALHSARRRVDLLIDPATARFPAPVRHPGPEPQPLLSDFTGMPDADAHARAFLEPSQDDRAPVVDTESDAFPGSCPICSGDGREAP